MNISTIITAIISSGFLAIMIKPLLDSLSKKNLRKLKSAKLRVKLYSPVVKFMTSVDFMQNSLSDVIEIIVQSFDKKRDYVSPSIIDKLNRLATKKARGEITELSTKDLFKLYLSIQIEYNKAKRDALMEHDIRYTSLDISTYSRWNYVVIALWILLEIILLIIAALSNTLDLNFVNSITGGIGFLAFISAMVIGLFFLINWVIYDKALLKDWEYIVFHSINTNAVVKGINTGELNV